MFTAQHRNSAHETLKHLFQVRPNPQKSAFQIYHTMDGPDQIGPDTRPKQTWGDKGRRIAKALTTR